MVEQKNLGSDEHLTSLRARAASLDAFGILELCLKREFIGRTAVVSSFGAESVTLLHLVATIEPNTPVLFINTGKLFGETLRYRDRLQQELGLSDVRSIGPNGKEVAATDPEGVLWSQRADTCCASRKIVPLRRALAGFDAQITGRKRFQTGNRAAMETVEYFEGRFRFNPLAAWSHQEIGAYVVSHNLPIHPLAADGYPSIGCQPCTRRVLPEEGPRAGRWPGLDKDECGIHGDADMGLR